MAVFQLRAGIAVVNGIARHVGSFALGGLAAVVALSIFPVSKDEMRLKGILNYAESLESFGLNPVFDPRLCELVDAPASERRDLGSYVVFYCKTETTDGPFYLYRGYDRSGNVVDGGQGFELEDN